MSEAHALRVWIGKLIMISERNIVELSVLEAEKVEEDSDDEEYDELQGELLKDFTKIKKTTSDHLQVFFTI